MSGLVGNKAGDVLLEAMKQPLLYLGAAMIVLASVTRIGKYDVAVRDTAWPYLAGFGALLMMTAVAIIILDRWRPADNEADVGKIGLQINHPRHRDRILIPETVSGTIAEWPTDFELWIFSLRADRYRPMHKISRDEESKWSTKYFTFHHDPTQALKFGIFAVGRGGAAQIRTYFHDMALVKSIKEDQEWHGMETIASDIVLCAEREIFIDGKRPGS